MGSAGYAHAGSVYRGDQSQESAIDRLMTITGGIKCVATHRGGGESTKQTDHREARRAARYGGGALAGRLDPR